MIVAYDIYTEINVSEVESTWIFNTAFKSQKVPAQAQIPSSSRLLRAPSQPSLTTLPMKTLTRAVSTMSIAHTSGSGAGGVCCDKCRKDSIAECRYKCLQCWEFNLCADCIGNNVHTDHVFALIDNPERSAKMAKAMKKA